MTAENANSGANSEDPSVLARAERLKSAVRKAGGSKPVADRSGVPFGTLNKYLAGREMRASAMIALARACGVSLDWLAEGSDPSADGEAPSLLQLAPSMDLIRPTDSSDSLSVKFFEAEPSAGNGIIPDHWEASEEYNISKHFLSNVLGAWSKKLFFVRIQGDSMTPTLRPGNTILVDYDAQSIMPSIYVIVMQGLLMVKRLAIKDMDNLSIISDNPRYGTFDVPIKRVCWASADPEADVRIVGRVIGRFDLAF